MIKFWLLNQIFHGIVLVLFHWNILIFTPEVSLKIFMAEDALVLGAYPFYPFIKYFFESVDELLIGGIPGNRKLLFIGW